MTRLRVSRLRDEAVIPSRAHAYDAGLDLVACEALVLQPGERRVVGTGIAVEIPEGYAGLVCPRSGLAARHGIGVVNSPGVIDAGYRGELRVVLHNTDREHSFAIEPGDRIAQLVIVAVAGWEVEETAQLSAGERAASGFGSTGGFSGARG